MATTLFHSFSGILWYRSRMTDLGPSWPWPSESKKFLWFVVLANLPDIDLLPRLLWGIPLKHGEVTHSLMFAAAVALFAGSWERRCFSFALIPFLLVLTHLAIDFTSGPNLGLHASYGVPWFYPLYPHNITSPLTLFIGTQHRTLAECFGSHNLLAVIYEFVLIVYWVIFIKLVNLDKTIYKSSQKVIRN
ncbi:MAG: metal-dependent hydrolase [Syntrophales bacterium]|nr:metal-dependent hydrolase [Syntrophales bacterium]